MIFKGMFGPVLQRLCLPHGVLQILSIQNHESGSPKVMRLRKNHNFQFKLKFFGLFASQFCNLGRALRPWF